MTTMITATDGTTFTLDSVVTVYCENDLLEGVGPDGRPIVGKVHSLGEDGSISVEFVDGSQGYYSVEELVPHS